MAPKYPTRSPKKLPSGWWLLPAFAIGVVFYAVLFRSAL